MSSATQSSTEHEQSESPRQSPVVEWINDWGGVVVDGAAAVGDFTLFVWRTLVWLLDAPASQGNAPSQFLSGRCA